MADGRDRIYHLKGTPFEIGCAMGRALGPKLGANIDHYVRARLSNGISLDRERWRSGALPWLRTLPDRFRSEFEGLSEGADLPLRRVAQWAYLEVLLSIGCSAAMVTLDDRVWVARNNDIFAPEMWGYVTIREVAGRIPTISFGLEGDVFTPTGINRERLWLHYNYAPAWDVPPADRQHLPDRVYLPAYAFLVEALETCRTLADLEALLARIPRDDGMLLFAVDGKTGDAALYECACTDFYRRDPTAGWLVGTNHYVAHPQVPPLSDLGGSTLRRYQRLQALIRQLSARDASFDPVEALIRVLADPGVEARQGETITAYANVACPGARVLWYTFGGYPAASRGNWHALPWPW